MSAKPQQLAALLSALLGATRESVPRQGGEAREDEQAATCTADGSSLNGETPQAGKPEASLGVGPNSRCDRERGLAL